MSSLLIYPINGDNIGFAVGRGINFLGLGYNVKWSPVFFNQSHKTMTGASIDIGLAQYPLHNFELTYPFLRDYPTGNMLAGKSELKIMMGFFLNLAGSLGRFDFINPDDYTVLAQILVNSYDGVTTAFPFVRTYGSSVTFTFSGTEPVGDVILALGPVHVYYNSVLKTLGVDYTLDLTRPGNNLLGLIGTLPAPGVQITADFSYAYYCKFTDDSLTFDKFVNQIWSAQAVKLQSCRPGA
jgi:hypothetical protein